MGAAAAVPHTGLWSLPEAAKDWRRPRAQDLVQHRGVVGDALVSLGGRLGSRANGIKMRQGSTSATPGSVLSYRGSSEFSELMRPAEQTRPGSEEGRAGWEGVR